VRICAEADVWRQGSAAVFRHFWRLWRGGLWLSGRNYPLGFRWPDAGLEPLCGTLAGNVVFPAIRERAGIFGFPVIPEVAKCWCRWPDSSRICGFGGFSDGAGMQIPCAGEQGTFAQVAGNDQGRSGIDRAPARRRARRHHRDLDGSGAAALMMALGSGRQWAPVFSGDVPIPLRYGTLRRGPRGRCRLRTWRAGLTSRRVWFA